MVWNHFHIHGVELLLRRVAGKLCLFFVNFVCVRVRVSVCLCVILTTIDCLQELFIKTEVHNGDVLCFLPGRESPVNISDLKDSDKVSF